MAGATGKVPIKPDALANHEYFQRFGLPLVVGGLLDQPYLIMLEMEVAANEFETLRAMQDAANSRNNAGT